MKRKCYKFDMGILITGEICKVYEKDESKDVPTFCDIFWEYPNKIRRVRSSEYHFSIADAYKAKLQALKYTLKYKKWEYKNNILLQGCISSGYINKIEGLKKTLNT